MGSIKKAMELYKRDMKTLATNWAAFVIMTGLIMLPPLYAWFNIAASMDPYANTGFLKTGIVSYDKGADLNNVHINAGNDVMNELRDNKNLCWVFYKTEEEAMNAVRFGEAYAAIVIPEDFSQNLISVTSHEPKKAVIKYYENDKINAITPKIMQKGAGTLQEEINANFIAAASKSILSELQSAGMELSANENKLRDYKQELYDLDGRMPDILFTVDNAVKVIDKNLEAVPRIKQRIPVVRGILNNSLLLSDNIDHTLNSAGTGMQTSKLLLEKNYDLIGASLSQSTDLSTYLSDLAKGGNKFLKHLGQNARKSVTSIRASIPAIKKDLLNAQDMSESALNEAQKRIGNVETLLSDYNDFLQKTDSTIAADGANAKQVADVMLDFNQKLKNAFDGLKQYMPVPLPNQVQQNLDYLYNGISGFLHATSAGSLTGGLHEAADLLLESIDMADSLLDGYSGAIDTVRPAVDGSDLHVPITNLAALKRTLRQYRNDLDGLKESANDKEKVAAYLSDLNRLSPSLGEQMQKFRHDYANIIVPALQALSNDKKVLQNDTKTLLSLLIQDLNLLESLLYEAESTGKDVDEYLKKLQSTLPNASGDIRNVADKLRQADNLYDLDNIIDMIVSSDTEKKDFIAKPTTLNTESFFPIPNYGSASAPFYTVLALWVGTLLLSSMLKLEVDGEYTSTQQFIGKYLLFFTVTQLQALVVTIGDLLIVKVYAAEPVLFVLLGLFTSFIFSMIVFSLVTVFGAVGKALGVVLLVLQLSASGGTFPIELTPGFFQTIHPYLPFTYAINAVREAVGGVIPALLFHNMRYLFVFYIAAAIFGMKLKQPINQLGRGFVEKLKASEMFEG